MPPRKKSTKQAASATADSEPGMFENLSFFIIGKLAPRVTPATVTKKVTSLSGSYANSAKEATHVLISYDEWTAQSEDVKALVQTQPGDTNKKRARKDGVHLLPYEWYLACLDNKAVEDESKYDLNTSDFVEKEWASDDEEEEEQEEAKVESEKEEVGGPRRSGRTRTAPTATKPAPVKKATKTKTATKANGKTNGKVTGKAKGKVAQSDDDDDEMDVSEEEEKPKAAKATKPKAKTPAKSNGRPTRKAAQAEESELSEEEEKPKTTKSKVTKATKSKASVKTTRGKIAADEDADNDTKDADEDADMKDEEEDEPEEKPKAKGKRAPAKGKSKVTKKAKDEDDEEEHDELEDDDEEDKASDEDKKKDTKKKVPDAPKFVKTIAKNQGPPVHDNFKDKDSYHVYEKDGLYMDAMLNQADLAKNANKFYVVQLLQSDNNSSQFVTFTTWGRVGERGQQGQSAFTNVDTAMREFEKKFKDKTGLTWDNRNGNSAPKKYTYLERSFEPDEDEEEGNGADSEKKEDTKAIPESTLPEKTQNLMKLIFNTSFIAETMRELEYDANKLPLGKLAKSTMQKGYAVLKEISDALSGNAARSKLQELSSKYYSLIPHSYGRNVLPLIADVAKLKKELELIEALGEMKVTQELMKIEKLMDVNPIDTQCKNLNLKQIDPIESDSEEFENLKKLLANTRGKTHNIWELELVDAFKIEREEDTARFEKGGFNEGGERRLLWHGSRVSNFGGILSQGLRIAPPEAPVTGYMFGKGIYLASMATKSAGYCCSYASNGTGLLMLCEAQIGKPMYEREQSEYNAEESCKAAGKLATWGIGQTQPSAWEDASVLDESLKGINIPSLTQAPEEVNGTSSLLYDEFIVYSVDQVKIKYLLRVDFKNTR